MKSFIKFVLTGIGLVLILMGVAAILVFTQAHDFFGARVGNAMSEAFGTQAGISGLRFSLRRHAIILKDFTLANPNGFPEGDALTCAQVYIVISPKSLIAREPVVELIDLQGATIRAHYRAGEGTNLGALSKSLAAAEGRISFAVETLRCADGKLELSTNLLPGASVPMTMSKIEIHDLESGAPVTAAKSTAIFLRTVLKEVLTIKGLGASLLDAVKGEVDTSEPPAAEQQPAA